MKFCPWAREWVRMPLIDADLEEQIEGYWDEPVMAILEELTIFLFTEST